MKRTKIVVLTHIHGIFHVKIRAVNIPNKIRTIDKIMSSSNHIKQLPQNGIPRNSFSNQIPALVQGLFPICFIRAVTIMGIFRIDLKLKIWRENGLPIKKRGVPKDERKQTDRC